MPWQVLTLSPMSLGRYMSHVSLPLYGGGTQVLWPLISSFPNRFVCVSHSHSGISQEPCGVDGEGAACGDPRGDNAEQHHGEDDAREHEWIAGAGEGDEVREQTRRQNSTDEADE